MPKLTHLKHIQQRNFSAHHILIDTAKRSFKTLEKQKAESSYDAASYDAASYDALIVMTFSALAIEAICNAIGERMVKNWKIDFESCAPVAKLRLLAIHMDIEFDRAVEPWGGAIWLIGFRNKIAHAKPEIVNSSDSITQEQYDKSLFDKPKSKLEQSITFENARRAIVIAEKIKDLLIKNIASVPSLGLESDGWSGALMSEEDFKRLP